MRSSRSIGQTFCALEKLEHRRVMSAPFVVSSVFEWNARQAVTFNFNQPIDPATVATTDLYALNLGNAQSPQAASAVISADKTSITWVMNANGAFAPDGAYRFELRTNAVANSAGEGLSPNYVLVFGDYVFLGGDANRDHRVNTLDFNLLASNFGQSGKTFASGNFDYFGTVDSVDYNILMQNFGKVVLPLASPTASGSVSASSDLNGLVDDLLP